MMDESFYSPELSKQFELVDAEYAYGSGAQQDTPFSDVEDAELNVETVSTRRAEANESIRPPQKMKQKWN